MPTRDDTAAERLLRALLLVINQPYRFTRRDLATRLDVDKQTIRRYEEKFVAVGLSVERDPQHRLAILPAGDGEGLRRLQPLNEADIKGIQRALREASAKTSDIAVLERKLASLRDYQQLGLRALRRPEIGKIDVLELASDRELRVWLVGYRSTNGNEVNDRFVEPFHLDTANGIVQCYDVARRGMRHFRLDRMDRVDLTEEPWAYGAEHRVEPTDPFRITSAATVRCHLTLDVAAYNDLVERFPQAQAHTLKGTESDTYDFDAAVNAEFRGILPFCLANYAGVTVRAPEGLRGAMVAAAEEIQQASR